MFICPYVHTYFLSPCFIDSFIDLCCSHLKNAHAAFLKTISYTKLCFETKSTKLFLKILLVKSFDNSFVFLPVFYLIMWLMKASKNFGKLAILKIWELISFGKIKTHFGKIALKWCICRHEIIFLTDIMLYPIKILTHSAP